MFVCFFLSEEKNKKSRRKLANFFGHFSGRRKALHMLGTNENEIAQTRFKKLGEIGRSQSARVNDLGEYLKNK